MNNYDCDNNLLLEQWQTCVQMANSVSERRDTMNNLFVSLNVAVITAISIIWDKKTIILVILGIVICISWLLFIRNFRELNKAKFSIITNIEKDLPILAFFEEWEILKRNKKYIEGTFLEKLLPYLFIITYFITILITFIN